MKGKRYGEEQIIYALKQAEAGVKVSEVCRTMGISEQTFYACLHLRFIPSSPSVYGLRGFYTQINRSS